ncbi:MULTISPECIES: toll/interleukin-1 receptor domain-containing protein [Streptomyces]|uniref:toll/interleukin-1 receptor domain-containing protein n=1 Tax=Streptomyces TaxID=1883 RepID=UPI0031D704AF
MDTNDSRHRTGPDHDWQRELVEALLDSLTLQDRSGRALLEELIGEELGRRLHLREHPTRQLQFLELVRACEAVEGGLPALAHVVSLLEGHSRTSDTVSALVRGRVTAAAGPRPLPRPTAHSPAPVPRPQAAASTPTASPDPAAGDGALDFFVSYTAVDRAWAAWIAWELEDAGHGVLVQEWDFVPGTQWPVGMERGVTQCARTIAVLSPDYLHSVYGRQEWQAVQAADPTGLVRRLVPVMVAPCTPEGLLASVVHIDLVGLPAEQARERLLTGVGAARSGRAKPALPPRFPG